MPIAAPVPDSGSDGSPGPAFRRVFCDILTDVVQAAPVGRPGPGVVSMDVPAVAVIIEDDEDIRGLVRIVL